MKKNKFIFRLSDVCTLANTQAYGSSPCHIHTEIRRRIRECEVSVMLLAAFQDYFSYFPCLLLFG